MFLLIASCNHVPRPKAFCSWLCRRHDSEWLWQGGREIVGADLRGTEVARRSPAGLKYLLMGFFVYAVLGMSADESGRSSRVRTAGADVKMMKLSSADGHDGCRGHGRPAGRFGPSSKNPLVGGTLCPYGALLGWWRW